LLHNCIAAHQIASSSACLKLLATEEWMRKNEGWILDYRIPELDQVCIRWALTMVIVLGTKTNSEDDGLEVIDGTLIDSSVTEVIGEGAGEF